MDKCNNLCYNREKRNNCTAGAEKRRCRVPPRKESSYMEEKKYAVLIDADNSSQKYIKAVIDEVSKEGVITYKRIYGDWTSPSLQSYKETLLEYSITPMQQYSYTTGKNATDSAMIIDAMDILFTADIDGFCLVSSDSDFTKLASRLREAGKNVIGMGRKQTPKAFVSACNSFKFLDIITGCADEPGEGNKSRTERRSAGRQQVKPSGSRAASKKKKDEENSQTPEEAIKKTIIQTIDENSDDEGWVLVSTIGSMLQKLYPDFDTRNFGCKKMTDFLVKLGFETKKYQYPNNKTNPTGYVMYVRQRT